MFATRGPVSGAAEKTTTCRVANASPSSKVEDFLALIPLPSPLRLIQRGVGVRLNAATAGTEQQQ
jgi:hypothetical protein